MKKPNIKEIKIIRKLFDKGRSIRKVSANLGIDLKIIRLLYKEYKYEQIAKNPRTILAKKIFQIQKAADKAIKNYNTNTRPEYAYAISSLNGELRAALQDIKSMVDIESLARQFLDQVHYASIIEMIQIFISELGSARDEMRNQLSKHEATAANEILKDLISDMKAKITDVQASAIQRTESVFSLDLQDKLDEVLILPESKRKKKKNTIVNKKDRSKKKKKNK